MRRLPDLTPLPHIKTDLGNKSKRRQVGRQAKQLGFKGIPYRNNSLTKTYCKHLNQHIIEEYSSGKNRRLAAFRDGYFTDAFKLHIKNSNDFVHLSKAEDLLRKHRYLFQSENARQTPLEVRFQSGIHGKICKPISCGKFYNLQGMLEKLADGIQRNSKGEPVNVWGEKIEGFRYLRMTIKFKKGGRDHKRRSTPKLKLANYIFNCIDPASYNNNCGIKCLQELFGNELNSGIIRAELDVMPKILLTCDRLQDIYLRHNPNPDKHLEIIYDEQFDAEMDFESTDYIYLHQDHYVLVKSAEKRNFKDKKTKRGFCYWDCETRETEEYIKIGNSRSYILKDTITSVCYIPYKQKHYHLKTFITDKQESSIDKFKKWLANQAAQGHFYNCYAHNGAKFDHYLFVGNFTANDWKQSNVQLRGTSVIQFSYKSHLFKDSCCFLANSLENLCKDFLDENEKQYSKRTILTFGGKEITSKQLCFYKPELGFWEFMELQHKEPEFWKAYVEYCEYDCLSLKFIWEKFTLKINSLIANVGKYILKRCTATSCATIGSLAKKIMAASNGIGIGLKPSWQYQIFQRFIGKDNAKYEFMKHFKRGGISHCNQPGRHHEGIVGVDIVSQYPAACIHMKIPVGASRWVEVYEPEAHGFYHVNDLKFKGDKSFKPVCAEPKEKHTSLEWLTGDIDECYTDSYMITYLQEHFGLQSFRVVRGLVSNNEMEGEKLFGKFVQNLFAEKRKQDKYKERKDSKYNKALRQTIKLLLNALTGKCVEDPSKYHKHVFNQDAAGEKALNGTAVQRLESDQINPWLTAGAMIYSYSKRLLFEYIRMLPNKGKDVIHVETDGIYFPGPKRKEFESNMANYDGEYPVEYGRELGNLDLEKVEMGVTYWLGKKFYYINDKCMRCKGIPLKTIDKHGNDVPLIDRELYKRVFAGESVVKRYSTIQKHLWTGKRNSKVCLTAHYQSRTVNPRMEYKIYT
jgi:hypothetical protein